MNKQTVLAAIGSFILTPCLAEITTDGTVGAALHLQGPQYHIGQELGSLRGNNLFHSFGRFNLNPSESATFTGNSHIQNVISRVTGGALSTIDGTLKSEVGSAAFYFINPAGIVFGQHAHVDVPGAFYASTAGELKFADGTKFSALNPQGNTLSMAAPEAFGFLGKQTGTMAVNGAELVFKPGATVQLSAAGINMDKAKLSGEGMDLQLASVGTAAQAVGVKTLPSFALAGNISLKDSTLEASGDGRGRVAVRAGEMAATNSQIKANNIGELDMPANQGIDMQVGGLSLDDTDITSDTSGGNSGTVNVNVQNELRQIKGSAIRTLTSGEGDAGTVTVKAGKIAIDGQNSTFVTGIASRARTGSSGNAGAVNVSAQQDLILINAGTISSITFGNGDAGNVIVKARDIHIDGQYAEFATGIMADAALGSTGNAGTVDVSVQKELALYNEGRITSLVADKGNGGNVVIKAGKILIDGQNSSKFPAGIATQTYNSAGPAGNLIIQAQNELILVNGAQISTTTFGEGDAGMLDIKAEKLIIIGQKQGFSSGIFSSAGDGSKGHAGNMNISVQKDLTLLNTGLISSSTFGEGNAATLNVNAETIRINTFIDPTIYTGILSASRENASGKPGSININATKSISMSVGLFSIASEQALVKPIKTNARLVVNSPRLSLSNKSVISAEALENLPASSIEINTSQLSMDNSFITTAAAKSDGGPITINSKDWALLKNSQITTSVGNIQNSSGTTTGDGGDITISADVLVMDSGFIQANTNRKNAKGGNINLNVKQLVTSNGNLQSGGYIPLIFKPNSGINVIQAAAPDGINGSITITAPQLNIVGTLVGLTTPQLDLNRVGHDPCSSTVRQSTMKKLGKGGIPYFNKGQDGYTIDRLLSKQLGKPAQTTSQSEVLPDMHDCQPKTSQHDHKI